MHAKQCGWTRLCNTPKCMKLFFLLFFVIERFVYCEIHNFSIRKKSAVRLLCLCIYCSAADVLWRASASNREGLLPCTHVHTHPPHIHHYCGRQSQREAVLFAINSISFIYASGASATKKRNPIVEQKIFLSNQIRRAKIGRVHIAMKLQFVDFLLAFTFF